MTTERLVEERTAEPLGRDMIRLSVRRVVDGDGSIQLIRVAPKIDRDSKGTPLSPADQRLAVVVALEAMSGMLDAALAAGEMIKAEAANPPAS